MTYAHVDIRTWDLVTALLALMLRLYPSTRFIIRIKVVKGEHINYSKKHVITVLILAILGIVLMAVVLIVHSMTKA